MDDETTGKIPPDDTDATRVIPPADEGATQVLNGDTAGATRVMPAAGGSPPAPPPVQPTRLMTHGRKPSSGGDGGGGGFPWWGWLIIVLVIVAAAAAAWFFYLKPSPAPGGDEFIGTWAPESNGGGGLVISRSGDQFKVVVYDDQLKQAGATTADLVSGELKTSVQAAALGVTGVTGTMQVTIMHESAADRLQLKFAAGDVQLEPVYFVRTDVLRPATPTPTPSPTLIPSPTGSPSPSASPSTSGTPSPAADQQVIDGIAKLQVGIVAWASNSNNLYPSPQDVVNGGGISQYVNPWPVNPFTSQPMTPGTSPGSYVYEQLNGGQGYKLTGYLSNGLTYTVP